MAPTTKLQAWFSDTRERHLMPDGEPWTQDYLLERMTEAGFKAPHRPNYSNYETGRAVPNKVTIAKFVEFWAKYDEPGPDLTPVVVEPEATMADLIKAQTEAIDRQTRALTAVLTRLGGQDPDLARLLDWVEHGPDTTPSPLPTGDRQERPARS